LQLLGERGSGTLLGSTRRRTEQQHGKQGRKWNKEVGEVGAHGDGVV